MTATFIQNTVQSIYNIKPINETKTKQKPIKTWTKLNKVPIHPLTFGKQLINQSWVQQLTSHFRIKHNGNYTLELLNRSPPPKICDLRLPRSKFYIDNLFNGIHGMVNSKSLSQLEDGRLVYSQCLPTPFILTLQPGPHQHQHLLPCFHLHLLIIYLADLFYFIWNFFFLFVFNL